jgi:drug/metabolite transporter (DMT)-like permease
MVLIVPLLVGLSGRRVATTTWVASVVALFGVGLLTTSDATPNVGDALCVLSAVLFGVQKWRSESATLKYAANTQELVAVQLGTLALAACVLQAPHVFQTVTTQSPGEIVDQLAGLPWGLLLYMGLATTAFTLWVEINALKDVAAPIAALIYTSEPLWGALFAWTLLGEHWGPTGWVGAFLIVTASLGAQLNSAEKTEEDEEERASVKVEVSNNSSK